MIVRRAYLFRLEEDGQTLNVFETADEERVEFLCEGGHFYLNREEAEKLAELISPRSYASDRIRYKRGTDETF